MIKTTPDVQETMSVSISRFGQSTITLNVAVDSTVAQTLAEGGIDTQGNEQIFVAGVSAQGADILEDGDIVSIVTPKQAGTN